MGSAIGLFGALEVAQRHYDLMWEVEDYLNSHPRAAVINHGCGLDDTFTKGYAPFDWREAGGIALKYIIIFYMFHDIR